MTPEHIKKEREAKALELFYNQSTPEPYVIFYNHVNYDGLMHREDAEVLLYEKFIDDDCNDVSCILMASHDGVKDVTAEFAWFMCDEIEQWYDRQTSSEAFDDISEISECDIPIWVRKNIDINPLMKKLKGMYQDAYDMSLQRHYSETERTY